MKGRLQVTLMLGLALGGIVVLAFAGPVRTVSAENEARKSLDAFNQEFVAACVRMDHKGDAEFWAEDGVDLFARTRSHDWESKNLRVAGQSHAAACRG